MWINMSEYLSTNYVVYSLWHGFQTNTLLQLLRKRSTVDWKTLNIAAERKEALSDTF